MTMIIAHRGVSAYAPENTLESFTLAWALDLPCIELDIQTSRDGKVVVHHDETTQRTAGVNFLIREHDLQSLQKLDVGSFKNKKYASARIPLLSEVVAKMPTQKAIQIEIKPEAQDMGAILTVLGELRKDISVMVISFDRKKLNLVKKHHPHLPLLWLLEKEDIQDITSIIQYAIAQGYQGLDLDYQIVTKSVVELIHQAGLMLCVWTVDDKSIADNLRDWGIDMIVSNRPHEI